MGRALSSFPTRLSALVEERRSQLVVGLDPQPEALWQEPSPLGDDDDDLAELLASAYSAHCRSVLDAVSDFCVAAKLQLACFERLGAPGWRSLAEVVAAVKEAGMLAILDGKRGDVPHTAATYAQALMAGSETPWGPVGGLGADAVTVNPLLGPDALAPFVEVAQQSGAGVFVLVRTSNPGSSDLQDLDVGGETLSERVARMVAALGGELVDRSGLASVGAVVAATAPERMAALRELMPNAVFLVPGIGAQGGDICDLAPAFTPGPAACLVTVSRSLVGAGGSGAEAAAAARREATRLRDMAWRLGGN